MLCLDKDEDNEGDMNTQQSTTNTRTPTVTREDYNEDERNGQVLTK
jgi:hypothetical protein